MPDPATIAKVAATVGGTIWNIIKGSGSAKEAARILREAGIDAATISIITGERVAQDIEATTNLGADVIHSTAEGSSADLVATGHQAATGLEDFRGRAEDLTRPYREGGERAFGILSDLAENPEEFEFEEDPGYQFRLSEGEKAIQRAAAASGVLQSGGTGKALLRYGQGFASHEFDRAFGRFDTNRKFRAGLLTDVAGFGERASAGLVNADLAATQGAGQFRLRGQEGAAQILNRAAESYANTRLVGTQAAGRARQFGTSQYANYLLGAAGAEASGVIGSANAWMGGVGSLAAIPSAYPGIFGGGGGGGGGTGPGSGYATVWPTP
jgi:hypothetical protein